MPPQLPPRLWRGRSAGAWVVLVLGLVVGVPVSLALGLLLLVLGVVCWVVAAVVWVVVSVAVWGWYGIQRARRVPYPFAPGPPHRRRARRVALSGLYLELVPRTIGGITRVAGWLFAPLALLVGVAGIVAPRWRARPYLAVFTLPDILLKVVNLGRRRGLLRDGHDARLLGYDRFLAEAFPHIHDFLEWWRDPHAPERYVPSPGLPDVPAALLGLHLGPIPDPLGQPGIAAGAMRRRALRTLRDVFLSQREIDDLCDPDLDDRADTGVIRVVHRTEHGRRHWIVQLPSTKSWNPRAGTAPNDLTADLVIGAEREATITRAALETMRAAGIAPDEPVLLTGFSLGGMVAAQVALRARTAGFTVTHLVVAGAPLGRIPVPEDIRVLALEHVLDIVPRIDARENPVRTEAAGLFLTVKAGPPLPVGFRLGALHQSTAYADTAALIEADPPDPRITAFLAELRVFLGPRQHLEDHAVLRAGDLAPQPSVPLYLHSTVQEGITRGTLRQTLRRIPGVIAVDVYQSRAGFATTILWNADVLVRTLEPWFASVERMTVYRGLLSLLKRRRAVGIHLRLQAKATPGVTWEATVQRMADGRWRETIDVTFDDAEARREFGRLFPGGAGPVVTTYPPGAFEPAVDVTRGG